VNMNLVSMATDRFIEYNPAGVAVTTAFAVPNCKYLHHECQTDFEDERVVWSLGQRTIPAPPGFTKRQLTDEAVLWDGTIPGNFQTRTIFNFDMFLNVTDRTADSNTTDLFWVGCPAINDNDLDVDDWSHGNSFKRATDGSGLMIASFRHVDAILAIAGIDLHGNPLHGGIRKFWQIGGQHSDYTFPDPSDKFYHQHDAQILPNGNILLVDNGNDRPGPVPFTRGLELRLDNTAKTATKVWEGTYTIPNGLKCFSFCCGSVQRLLSGNTLVQFPNCVNDGTPFPGQFAYLVEFDPAGNVVSSFRTHLVDFVAYYRSAEFGTSIGGEVVIS